MDIVDADFRGYDKDMAPAGPELHQLVNSVEVEFEV